MATMMAAEQGEHAIALALFQEGRIQLGPGGQRNKVRVLVGPTGPVCAYLARLVSSLSQLA